MKIRKKVVSLLVVVVLLMQLFCVAAYSAEVVGDVDQTTIHELFTVRFVDRDEKLIFELLVIDKAAVPAKCIPQEPEVEGHEFKGWKSKGSSTLKKIVEDTVFIATYAKIEEAAQPAVQEQRMAPEQDADMESEAIEATEASAGDIFSEEAPIEEEPTEEEPNEVEPIEEEPTEVGLIEEELIEEEPTEEEPIQEDSIDEVPVPERSVTVTWVLTESETVCAGAKVAIKANPVGFDDVEYSIQWQYNDGQGWVDVQGDELTLELIVAEDFSNLKCEWRVIVKPR